MLQGYHETQAIVNTVKIVLKNDRPDFRPAWFGLFVSILVRIIITLVELIFDFIAVEMHPKQ